MQFRLLGQSWLLTEVTNVHKDNDAVDVSKRVAFVEMLRILIFPCFAYPMNVFSVVTRALTHDRRRDPFYSQ